MFRIAKGFPGGNFSRTPVFNNGTAGGMVSNGQDIYAYINLGLHFLIAIAIILLIFYALRRLTKYPSLFNHHPDKALAVLNDRFARGEIDRDEYLMRKQTLGYRIEMKN